MSVIKHKVCNEKLFNYRRLKNYYVHIFQNEIKQMNILKIIILNFVNRITNL